MEARRSGRLDVPIPEVDDIEFGLVLDFANAQIGKDIFLEWAREHDLPMPSEFKTVKSSYVSTAKVAGDRWSPKKEEEQKVKALVEDLLSKGCLCDHEQIKKVVSDATDENGTMIIPMVNLSEAGLLKAVKAVYLEKSPGRIRGTAGFKRTNDCPLHK